MLTGKLTPIMIILGSCDVMILCTKKNCDIILKATETNTYSKQIFYWKDLFKNTFLKSLTAF